MTDSHRPASPAFSEVSRYVESHPQHSSQTSTLTNNSRNNSTHSLDHLINQDEVKSSHATDTSISNIAHKPSLLEEDAQQPTATALAVNAAEQIKPKDQPVTWMSLPKKGQLVVLTLARLSEPLSERSLAAYVFYQLRSFDPNLPDSTITSQGGMLTAAFAAAQFLTAVWWGRAADSPRIGRKNVLLVGLFGTALASIGVGFSKSFVQALIFRFMAGALNGNIGVMRTMISEMIEERKYQSRAFLILPMCFNIGVIIGPIAGGILADPISSFPHVFGAGSVIGGKDGVGWMRTFPYALPNLFSGIFITMSALAVIFGLDETHKALKHKEDWGRRIGNQLARALRRKKDRAYTYHQLETDETELQERESSNLEQIGSSPSSPRHRQLDSELQQRSQAQSQSQPVQTSAKSPFRQILTRNILLTLLSHYLLALHVSTFNTLIFLFLPSPRSSNQHSSFLRFTGGLSLSSRSVGFATAIIGLIGFPLQIILYPRLNTKLGTLTCYKSFLPGSLIAYLFIPFLALISPSHGVLLWTSLTIILACQVLSRTFALPSTVILINNSSPNSEVLGTVHGVAQSVSSAARMIGPSLGGWGLGMGLKENCVGGVWWAMAGVVVLNWGLLWGVYEGDGRGGKV